MSYESKLTQDDYKTIYIALAIASQRIQFSPSDISKYNDYEKLMIKIREIFKITFRKELC